MAEVARYVLWPYLKLEYQDRRLWVRDARRPERIPCQDGLLRMLEVFARGAPLTRLRERFAIGEEDVAALLEAQLLMPVLAASPPAPARLALCSTMLRPGPSLKSFIDYHLRVGITRLYLFFEDSADPGLALARSYRQVTAVVTDAAFRRTQEGSPLWERFAPHLASEVMARQCLNAQTALDQAAADAMDWLVHLDADELLWSGEGLASYFALLPPDVGQVLCLNHEAVPETIEVEDRFLDVTLFKRPVPLCDGPALRRWLKESGQPTWFVGYSQGKAAVRVAPGALAQSVHEFSPSPAHPYTVTAIDPTVLHYARCGLSQYRVRYEEQARPGGKCFVSPQAQATHRRPNGAGAPRIAFDVRAAAAFREDRTRAQEIYRCEIMLGGALEVERLMREGHCDRQLGPRAVLQGDQGAAVTRVTAASGDGADSQ